MPVVARVRQEGAGPSSPPETAPGNPPTSVIDLETAVPEQPGSVRPTLGTPVVTPAEGSHATTPAASPRTTGPATVQRSVGTLPAWGPRGSSMVHPETAGTGSDRIGTPSASGPQGVGVPTIGMRDAPSTVEVGSAPAAASPNAQRRTGAAPSPTNPSPGTRPAAAASRHLPLRAGTSGGSRHAPTSSWDPPDRAAATALAATQGLPTTSRAVAVQRQPAQPNESDVEPSDETWLTQNTGGSAVLGPRSAAPPLAGTPIPDAVGAPTAPMASGEGGGRAAPGRAAQSFVDRGQLDSLADDLYDKIRDRLKSELRVDRERRGRVTDLAG